MIRVGGAPLERPPSNAPDCERCPKTVGQVPRTRFNRVELDDRGWQAWAFYRRCKALGRFPDDEAVAQAAVEIEAATESVERERRAGEVRDAVLGAGLELLKVFRGRS